MARSIDTHKPDCPCPACLGRRQGGRGTQQFLVRIPNELAVWVRANGGVALLRRLAERAREDEREAENGC